LYEEHLEQFKREGLL